jgi:hypothetical protein
VIDNGLVICNIPGIKSLYHVLALVACKNILIIGGYQMYFWPQKNHDTSKKIYLRPTPLDHWIPAVPEIFWIYSPAYYLFFSLAILCLDNYHVASLNAWLMLMHSSFWFTKFPTAVDPRFRKKIRKVPTDTLTKYIMDMVHLQDTEDNACPSMHCAFAVFLAFITYPFYPNLSILFPVIIALSCLLSKQHLLVDILPGFLLGGIHGSLNMLML